AISFDEIARRVAHHDTAATSGGVVSIVISVAHRLFSEGSMSSFRLVVVSAFLLFAIACGGSSSTAPSPSPTPAPGGPSSSFLIPAGASTLGNRAYAPDDVNISVGDTVTWMNNDSTGHTSTSDGNGWN